MARGRKSLEPFCRPLDTLRSEGSGQITPAGTQMRAFIALEIPSAVRRAIAQCIADIRHRLPEASWVGEHAYHLTLLFIGEIGESDVPVLAGLLRPVFSRRRRLSIQLASAGTFPPGRPARVAWVGTETPGPIIDLAEAVRVAGGRFVQGEERRPFRPHLTVARCRRPWPRSAAEDWMSTLEGRIGEPFKVGHGVLMRSRLGAGGARYDVVAELPLGTD